MIGMIPKAGSHHRERHVKDIVNALPPPTAFHGNYISPSKRTYSHHAQDPPLFGLFRKWVIRAHAGSSDTSILNQVPPSILRHSRQVFDKVIGGYLDIRRGLIYNYKYTALHLVSGVRLGDRNICKERMMETVEQTAGIVSRRIVSFYCPHSDSILNLCECFQIIMDLLKRGSTIEIRQPVEVKRQRDPTKRVEVSKESIQVRRHVSKRLTHHSFNVPAFFHHAAQYRMDILP